MKITMEIYEKFLDAFDWTFPTEMQVIDKFETVRFQELLTLLNIKKASETRQLYTIQECRNSIEESLNTIIEMRKDLSIPESKSESEIPKMTFNFKNSFIDEAISIREVKSVMDNAGFVDKDGKSEYWQTPMTTAFYIYFNRICNK